MEPDEIRAIVRAVEARSGPGVEMLPGTLQEVNDTQGVVLLDGTTQPAGVNVVTECEPGDRVMVLFVPPRGGFVVGRFAVAEPESYRFVEQLRFTTPGTSTFDRSLYPWLRAVNVKVQGGGGSGGGVISGAANAAGGGGGSGGYCEAFVVADVVPTSVTVAVGQGGVPTVGNPGVAGGSSAFGGLLVAGGGFGGTRGFGANRLGGGGNGGDLPITGDIRSGGVNGEAAHSEVIGAGNGLERSGPGAGGVFGGGGRSTSGGDGLPGTGPGAGGGGACNRAPTTARRGGNGASGIVIVDLYA